LDTLINHQPRQQVSSVPPQIPRNVAGNGMEYFETFEFFNYPRLAASGSGISDPSLQFNMARYSDSVETEPDWLAANLT
jgi:hypothetical protein